MGTIVNILDLRKRASKANTSAFFEQVIPYYDFFENKRVVLAELIHNTYGAILNAHLDPDSFKIDVSSMTSYVASLFNPNTVGEEIEGPSFYCHMDGNLYCVVTRVKNTGSTGTAFLCRIVHDNRL